MPTPIPSESEHRIHVAVIAVAAVVALAMLGAAAWAVTRPKPAAPPGQTQFTPAEETSQGATTATSSAGETSSATSTSGTAASTSATSTGDTTQSATTPDYALAYHLGAPLILATIDTKTTTPMHVSGQSYALSPDGTTLAAAEKGKLLIAKAGTHSSADSAVTPGLPAEDVAPVWLPDSSAVLYVRANSSGIPHVWRYTVASGAARDLGAGSGMAVSPGGGVIAIMPTEDSESAALTVWGADGVPHAVAVPGGDPVSIAVGKNRIFASTLATSGASEIWSMATDGSDPKRLVRAGSAGELTATYGELMLSPDGATLLYAADGDDGYSRLWYVPSAGGVPKAISGRRDGYAVRWSDTSKGIYFIDGNAYQGQPTALYYMDLNRRNRKLLVAGASI